MRCCGGGARRSTRSTGASAWAHEIFLKLLKAKREVPGAAERQKTLAAQDGKCALCGCGLTGACELDPGPLSLEGVFQMAYILPERLLALVRPAFDLVLRRIRSLKRCVQACGCKIETPRYACNLAPGCISSEPTFAGLRKTKKKENKGSQKKGSPKKREKGFPLAKLDIA